MKIAIISDIHDNSHNLISALKIIENKKVDQIIFLGDFINNGIAKILASFKIPTFAIWGNNDGDKVAITKTSLDKKSNLEMSGNIYDFLEFDSKKIFLTHYPNIARSMAKSGDYDIIFYGHNHLKNLDKIGKCIVCNPGEISAHKTDKPTFVIYDTKENSIKFIEVTNSVTTKTKEAKKYIKKIKFDYNKTKGHQY